MHQEANLRLCDCIPSGQKLWHHYGLCDLIYRSGRWPRNGLQWRNDVFISTSCFFQYFANFEETLILAPPLLCQTMGHAIHYWKRERGHEAKSGNYAWSGRWWWGKLVSFSKWGLFWVQTISIFGYSYPNVNSPFRVKYILQWAIYSL